MFICLSGCRAVEKRMFYLETNKQKTTHAAIKNINTRSIVDLRAMKGKNSKALEDNIRKQIHNLNIRK